MTVHAVGTHIGDMDLTAGPALAEMALRRHRVVLIALTPGERGHPRLSIADYKKRKMDEGETFAAGIGAQLHIFVGSDGFLGFGEPVANTIRDPQPTTVIGHWAESIHPDHANSALITERARYLAGAPMEGEVPLHGVRRESGGRGRFHAEPAPGNIRRGIFPLAQGNFRRVARPGENVRISLHRLLHGVADHERLPRRYDTSPCFPNDQPRAHCLARIVNVTDNEGTTG